MSGLKLGGIASPWSYILTGLLALGLVAAIVFGVKSCKEIDQDNNNAIFNNGVAAEQLNSQGETLNAVQNANDAVRNPTSNELNVVCSRYDRNCSNHS